MTEITKLSSVVEIEGKKYKLKVVPKLIGQTASGRSVFGTENTLVLEEVK